MRDALVYSVLSHAVIMVIGYFGLPYIQREAVLTDTPIMVEIVNVDEVTNAPPPAPKPVNTAVVALMVAKPMANEANVPTERSSFWV
mgnify:CR=1 FL=1